LLAQPVFGFSCALEIHLEPLGRLDFLDLSVRMLNFDQIVVLVDGDDLEDFVPLDVAIPATGYRVQFTTHRSLVLF